jgi:transcriptional regulator of arginine metabolism
VNVLNTRAARQEMIIEIIRAMAVASQSELVELLRQRGIDVTQATVSRDLDDIGAVKTVAADGRLLYGVPAEGGEDRIQADELEDINARLVRVAEDTMVSIAQYLASAFDHSHLHDVIGTVAGDDTILLVVAESSSGAAVAERLKQLIKNRR